MRRVLPLLTILLGIYVHLAGMIHALRRQAMKKVLIISIIMCAAPLYFAITIYPISGVQDSRAESFEAEEPQLFDYCGDANNDGTIDIDDAVYLLEYIFQGGPPPAPYLVASGDTNGSCQVDIDDVVYTIAYIFSGGPPTCPRTIWIRNCGECIPGDVNQDGIVDTGDLEYIDFCSANPELCEGFPPCCADVDDNGTFDVDDVVYLTSYVHVGEPAPMPSLLCLY